MPDFPASLVGFQRQFPDDGACAAWLSAARWPSGFRCPACAGPKGWPHGGKPFTFECAACGKQTSVTAGTVSGSKLPLIVWFWAAYLMATHSNGISALQLQKQLGLGSYKSAWLLCAKLRRAMVAPGRAPLAGLIDDQIPLRTKADPVCGGGGRSPQGKMLVAGAVEVDTRPDAFVWPRSKTSPPPRCMASSPPTSPWARRSKPTAGRPTPAPPTSGTSPVSLAPWPRMSFCPGSTAPSPTRRPGRSASITDCEDSISKATSTNSPSASTDAEPDTRRFAHFSQSPSSESR